MHATVKPAQAPQSTGCEQPATLPLARLGTNTLAASPISGCSPKPGPPVRMATMSGLQIGDVSNGLLSITDAAGETVGSVRPPCLLYCYMPALRAGTTFLPAADVCTVLRGCSGDV